MVEDYRHAMDKKDFTVQEIDEDLNLIQTGKGWTFQFSHDDKLFIIAKGRNHVEVLLDWVWSGMNKNEK